MPQRQCVVTRERHPQAALLRLVLDPQGRPWVDLLGRAPGRGVYVKAEREVFLRLFQPKQLARAFKGPVAALSAEQAEAARAAVVEQLQQRLIQLAQLARRAGELWIGLTPTLEAIQQGACALLLSAEDLQPRSRTQLERGAGACPAAHLLTSKAALGEALGRGEVGVVGLKPGRIASRARWEAARREGLIGPQTTAGARRVSLDRATTAKARAERADKV